MLYVYTCLYAILYMLVTHHHKNKTKSIVPWDLTSPSSSSLEQNASSQLLILVSIPPPSLVRLLWLNFCLQWPTEIKITNAPVVHKVGMSIPFLIFILLNLSAGFNTPLITPWLLETLLPERTTLLKHRWYSRANFMSCYFCVSFASSPSVTRLVNVGPAPEHSP